MMYVSETEIYKLHMLSALLLQAAFVNDPCASPSYFLGPVLSLRSRASHALEVPTLSAVSLPTGPRAALSLPGRSVTPTFLLLVLENPAPQLLQHLFLCLQLSWESWSHSLL